MVQSFGTKKEIMNNTQLIYLNDSYQQQTSAKILEIIDGAEHAIILDRTLFYPQGGGQPADQGTIKGSTGSIHVTHVSYNGGNVLHKGKIEGNLEVGGEVELTIDWDRRYQHMQQHTAGHIVDQAVKNIIPNANSIDGNHGISKKMYIEFTTQIASDLIPQIQEQTNEIVHADLPIVTEMITHDELMKRQIKLPFDLPKDKPLRIVQIGDYPEMPDGGTQLKTTGECWTIIITGIEVKDGKCRVIYEVEKNSKENTAVQKTPRATKVESTEAISLEHLDKIINEITLGFKQDLVQNNQDIETKYLGKKGIFNQHASSIKNISPSDRKIAGQKFNELKNYLETQIAEHKNTHATKTAWVDLTAPGLEPKVGHMHPISQAMEEITRIFEQIGFTRVRYPEVDWDWYVFESLNMPPDHPARDEWETFFIDAPDTTKKVEYDASEPRKRHPSLVGGKVVLTTHTSNGQVREMERLNSTPPIRMINIARCYRRQQDATHTQMFHQFEGLVVDKGITIQNLKGTLDYFAEQFYGPGTKSRIRPFHFQFTEPSFEVDFSCHICHGTGKVDGNKCKFCKSGWHEVGGAGMVHPNVLKAGGINPDEYTGFAFGWGIERTYTLKEGLNIDDIRLLYSGDLRFLEQF